MTSPTPGPARKYRQIADDLRQAINAGEYGPGARLPGENDLARTYDVTPMTARRAIAELTNEGLVVPRTGAGVYVREFRPLISDRVARLSPATWGSGRSIWSGEISGRQQAVTGVEVTEGQPSPNAAVLLDLEDGTAVIRSRSYTVDGKPVLMSTSYIPASIASGTAIAQPDPGPGGIYARLADLDHAPAHFREDVRARMPEPGEVEALGLSPGTPVVEIIRTAYTNAGKAVEVSEMIADAFAYILRYDFDAIASS